MKYLDHIIGREVFSKHNLTCEQYLENKFSVCSLRTMGEINVDEEINNPFRGWIIVLFLPIHCKSYLIKPFLESIHRSNDFLQKINWTGEIYLGGSSKEEGQFIQKSEQSL